MLLQEFPRSAYTSSDSDWPSRRLPNRDDPAPTGVVRTGSKPPFVSRSDGCIMMRASNATFDTADQIGHVLTVIKMC